MAIDNNSAGDLQLIVPNLHRRYSGVTATNRMVSPKLAKMFRAGWLGPDAPLRVGAGDVEVAQHDVVHAMRSRDIVQHDLRHQF